VVIKVHILNKKKEAIMLNVGNIFSLPYSIIYLLPYSPDTILNNRQQKLQAFHFIQSIFNFSIIALETFIQGNISAFDAQVGENMCEIRAHKNFTLVSKTHTSVEKDCEIRQQLKKFISYKEHLGFFISEWESKVIRIGSHSKDLDDNEDLHTFLERNGVFFELTEDSIYIITCYFLSHFCFRENGLPISMNYDFIKRELHISKYKAKRLTQKYQIIVSKLGVDFVLGVAQSIENPSSYIELFPLVNRVSDDNRVALPCLFTSEILLKHCMLEKKPIFVVIRRQRRCGEIIDIICVPIISNDEQNFIMITTPVELNKFCIVMSGDVLYENNSIDEDWRIYAKRLISSFTTYLLANMACHPQYAGSSLSHLKDNPFNECLSLNHTGLIKEHLQKINDLRKQALILGCTKKFPTTLLLRHIYASTFRDEIDKIKREHGCMLNIAHN